MEGAASRPLLAWVQEGTRGGIGLILAELEKLVSAKPKTQ